MATQRKVAQRPDHFLWVTTHPGAPGRTVDLHVDEAGRQDAAPTVPLLIGHSPLFKEQFLGVQYAAFAHPQILPMTRARRGKD